MLELGVDRIGSVLTSETDWKKSNIKETVTLVNSGSGKSSLIPLFSEPDTVFNVLDYYGPHIVHFCEALTNETTESRHLEDLIRLQEDVKKGQGESQTTGRSGSRSRKNDTRIGKGRKNNVRC